MKMTEVGRGQVDMVRGSLKNCRGQPCGIVVKFGALCFGSPGSQVQFLGTDLHHSVSSHAVLVAHILKNRGRLA